MGTLEGRAGWFAWSECVWVWREVENEGKGGLWGLGCTPCSFITHILTELGQALLSRVPPSPMGPWLPTTAAARDSLPHMRLQVLRASLVSDLGSVSVFLTR